MTEATTVDRDGWARFFDLLTADHKGKLATIELADADFGHGHETERLPFNYASYDHRDDVVVVGIGGESARFPVLLRHMINHPVEIDFAVPRPTETDVRVVDSGGTTTILRLRPKPALPDDAT
ncbi:MAG: hypothetical protein JWO67_2761 [Streptosporangiaceae bacterium]|jgi:hypothetical protein|nr:hypothetical protein [Streptosporangiaceae bacterium]